MTGLLSDHKCYSGIFSVTSSEAYLIEFFLCILTHVRFFSFEVWTLRLILFISQRIFLMLKTYNTMLLSGFCIRAFASSPVKSFAHEAGNV